MFKLVLVAATLPLLCIAQGGMAELKSITGDEPYNGVGNAPAPIPQPMGFWGRPRYSPMSPFGSAGPYGGGSWGYGNPYGGPYDRFSSFSHSPYGEVGHHPLDMLSGVLSSLLSDDDVDSRSSFRSPSRSSFDSSASAFSGDAPSASSFSSPSRPSSLSSSSSNLPTGLGGFYTGKGN